MKRTLFLLLTISALFVGCMPCARCQAQGKLDKKIGDHDAQYNNGQRVDALSIPADKKPWLTLVLANDYENRQRDSQVLNWFFQHPRLVAIRNSVHFTYMRVGDPRYADSKEAGGMGSAYGTITPAIGLTRAVAFPGEKDLPRELCTYEGAPQWGHALKNPDVLADVIYKQLSTMYPPPVFAGQTESTAIVPGESFPCPPDGCNPPWKPTPGPNVNPNPPQPPEVGPPMVSNDLMIILAVVGCLGLLFMFLVVGGVVIYIPVKKQTPAPSGSGSLL